MPGRFRPLATNEILNVAGADKFLVSAARRSGHHAVINWLMNSLEGVAVDWPNHTPVLVSPSGSVVFVNDLQERIDYERHIEVLRNSELIGRASAVVVNVEDADIARWKTWRFTLQQPRHKIYVRRPVLDLIASRLSHTGGYTPVDEGLLKMLAKNLNHLETWTVIDFHRWSHPSPEYRRRILGELGLDVDLKPGIAPHGGGSSFTGKTRIPSHEELASRHLHVDWPRWVIDLLLDREHRVLLESREVEFLEQCSRRRTGESHG